MEDILTYGIVGGLIGLLMVYLNKSAARQIAPVREDVFELHLHKLYQVIGWIALILGIVLLIVPTVYGGLEGLSVGLIMFVLFAGLGWACLSWHKITG